MGQSTADDRRSAAQRQTLDPMTGVVVAADVLRAVDRVEVGQGQPVNPSAGRRRVPHGDGIERSNPPIPLVDPGGVVPLWPRRQQFGVLAGQRSGAVAGLIGAQHAQSHRRPVEVPADRPRVRRRCSCPRRIGVQATPFVEQHTLCPFEHQPAGGRGQLVFVGDPYRAGELRVDLHQLRDVRVVVGAGREQRRVERGQGVQLAGQHPDIQAVADPDGGVGRRTGRDEVLQPITGSHPGPGGQVVPGGFTDPEPAGPVPHGAAGVLPGAVGGRVHGGGQQRIGVHRDGRQRVVDAEPGQPLGLSRERDRLHQHGGGQVRRHSGQRAGAELPEGVVPAVGQDVVRRLRSAVEPDDGRDTPLRAQPVDRRTLALVAESQSDEDHVTVAGRPLPTGHHRLRSRRPAPNWRRVP